MGGATRNLVAHLLHNDPVSAQAAYAAVRARFWGLVVASLLVLLWIGFASFAAFLAFYTIFAIIFVVAALLSLALPPWIGITLAVIAGLAALVGVMVVFFFIVGRVAYVPQVMLVEGKSVFDAFSRSFTLARGNVRRLMAMTLFTSFATYSALMILLLPLGVVAYLIGVNPLVGGQSPMWYQIAYGVLATSASIVLTPVWMLGLSLLYVDERVRHEGYDIELMAAQQLGEYPDQGVDSPFGTALSGITPKAPPPPPMASGRVLNLG
jgi:Preprotein translocase subunit SecD